MGYAPCLDATVYFNGSVQVRNLRGMAWLSLGLLVTLLNVSGCARDDHGPYRWEHGDRVDREGHRDVRWCDAHHEDEHCR